MNPDLLKSLLAECETPLQRHIIQCQHAALIKAEREKRDARKDKRSDGAA